MNIIANLTSRETEIAELFAWGASKREVADHLNVSERTVENHARNIYVKIGCGKVNELSAWWFCTRFNISFELSPLKRKIVSLCMLFILMPQIYGNCDVMIRHTRTKTSTIRNCRSRRKNETDCINDLIDFV
jgi:DNA-binding CsgD family transcriptional regulator